MRLSRWFIRHFHQTERQSEFSHGCRAIVLRVKRILFLFFSCYSSFTALRHVFGPWLPRCWGFEIIDISRGKDLSARDSSVPVATRYGLEGPGIESRWARFSALVQTGSKAPSLQHNGYRVVPGLKRPGCGVDHPYPSSAEVKERAELYLYSPSGPSWPVLG